MLKDLCILCEMVFLLLNIKISLPSIWVRLMQLQHFADGFGSYRLATLSRHKSPDALGAGHGKNKSHCGSWFSVDWQAEPTGIPIPPNQIYAA